MAIVDLQAVTAGLVHQVQADNNPVGDFKHLQDQIEIALEAGGINDDHGYVGLAKENKIACDFFIQDWWQAASRCRADRPACSVLRHTRSRLRRVSRSYPASCPYVGAGRSGR